MFNEIMWWIEKIQMRENDYKLCCENGVEFLDGIPWQSAGGFCYLRKVE